MLGYFVKYLSQANIANAYASGMKEALNFQGDQYNVSDLLIFAIRILKYRSCSPCLLSDTLSVLSPEQ